MASNAPRSITARVNADFEAEKPLLFLKLLATVIVFALVFQTAIPYIESWIKNYKAKKNKAKK